jgi:hypothetical protein
MMLAMVYNRAAARPASVAYMIGAVSFASVAGADTVAMASETMRAVSHKGRGF